jgi:hypothetical protein
LQQITPQYLPQLAATLRMPQSVGALGGRPGSSLYLVGYQGTAVLHLDPHQVQEAAVGDADWGSFTCDALRTVGMEGLDPSLALGFYCGSLGMWCALSLTQCFIGCGDDVALRKHVLNVTLQGSTMICVSGWQRWTPPTPWCA